MDRKNRGSAPGIAVVLMFAVAACAAGCAGYKSGDPVSRKTQLAKLVFAAVDVETTGLDPGSDRIVEIGVVKFRNGRKISSRSWLVNPGIPIPPSAVKIHGITTEMVRKSPGFEKVLPEFVAFVGESVILAHNARYDVSFFDSEIKRACLTPPQNHVVDTLPVFRQWFPRASRHTMAFMVEYLKIDSGEAHRGVNDATALYEVFKAGAAGLSPKLTLDDLISTAGGELHFAAPEEQGKPRE